MWVEGKEQRERDAPKTSKTHFINRGSMVNKLYLVLAMNLDRTCQSIGTKIYLFSLLLSPTQVQFKVSFFKAEA